MSDGESGLLVPVGDVEALSWAMIRLATDGCLRDEMGQNARTACGAALCPTAADIGLGGVLPQFFRDGASLAMSSRRLALLALNRRLGQRVYEWLAETRCSCRSTSAAARR